MLLAVELGADGPAVMTAQVAAAEVAARLTAAVTLGSARGQTAAHTHAAATVVGCGVIFTIAMEAESAPFIRGADSPLPALGFSVGYNLAAALQTGGLDVDDLHDPALASPERWELAGRVRLRHDEDLTVAALAATAPVGAAISLAGERARGWLMSRGASSGIVDRVLATAAADPDFDQPSKRIGARLRVRLRDGRVLEAEADAARGCCQEPVADRLALAAAKFVAQASPTGGDGGDAIDPWQRYEGMTAAELRGWRDLDPVSRGQR